MKPSEDDYVELNFTVAGPVIDPEAEEEMLRLVNEKRARHGLPELVFDETIRKVARLHLIIIGGGYIGLKFGQIFRRFGSKVTILHRAEHLLSREDRDVAEEIAKIFHNEGIEVLFNTETL